MDSYLGLTDIGDDGLGGLGFVGTVCRDKQRKTAVVRSADQATGWVNPFVLILKAVLFNFEQHRGKNI